MIKINKKGMLREELIHIDNLCQECGYFDADYICKNPNNEDNKCLASSCPIGYEASEDDIMRLEPGCKLTSGEWVIKKEEIIC